MVQRDLVSRKVARASGWIDDARALLGRPREQFASDRSARDLATFYLFLAIQECIDLAAHWSSEAGLGPAEEAGSSFDLLAEARLIDSTLATEMRGAVALRNRVAHGYASVDHRRLYEDAVSGISALRRFLAALAGSAGL